jgi:hypothetical protein
LHRKESQSKTTVRRLLYSALDAELTYIRHIRHRACPLQNSPGGSFPTLTVRGAQIPGAKSPGRQNFVRYRMILEGSCFMALILALRILGNSCTSVCYDRY